MNRCQFFNQMVIQQCGSQWLPPTYQRVEYLTFSGTQYINTGIVPTNMETIIKINQATYQNNGAYFGTSGGSTYYHVTPYSNKYYMCVGSGESSYGSWSSGTKEITYNKLLGDGFYIDGVQISSFSAPRASNVLMIGNRSGASILKGDIYSFKLTNTQSGEVAFNGIPCYRKLDNKPGMYDTVSGTFFTNAGSGEFTVGPDIVDFLSVCQQVEYLQSTGTQYIDTGITLPDNYERIKLKINGQSTTSSQRYCSSWLNNSGPIISYPGTGPFDKLWVGPSTNMTVTATSINTDYEMDITADNGNLTGSYCGIAINTTYTGSVYTGNSLYLFAEHGSSGASGKCSAKIYYFKLYSSAGLVRDFIPCYRKSDDKPGMYDRVSKTFFTNAGTGEFTVGPEV